VLLQGEECYLGPTPERDTLLSALCLVEAVTGGGEDLSALSLPLGNQNQASAAAVL